MLQCIPQLRKFSSRSKRREGSFSTEMVNFNVLYFSASPRKRPSSNKLQSVVLGQSRRLTFHACQRAHIAANVAAADGSFASRLVERERALAPEIFVTGDFPPFHLLLIEG
jgi:hypothetical protein